MHRSAVWQHNRNWNIKIVHNSIEHFLWNPPDFSSDDVLSCLWTVFANSVFQVPPQKIVKWVEMLGIGWPGVLSLTWNESIPWEVMPEVFKVFCSRNEVALHFSNRTLEYLRHNFLWDRLISGQTNKPWSSYSQDLDPPDYFLRGTWKTEFVKTIHRQHKTSSEETSNGFHKKCSIEL